MNFFLNSFFLYISNYDGKYQNNSIRVGWCGGGAGVLQGRLVWFGCGVLGAQKYRNYHVNFCCQPPLI